MDAQQYEVACAKFRESQRLDPAVGTQFNLADCEERRGHVAESWSLFRAVAEQLPKGDERLAIAKKRAAALESRLARLTIVAAPSARPGTTVRRDGVELGAASFGVAIAVDPGAHEVVVTSPGRATQTVVVQLAVRESKTIDVAPGAPLPSAPAGVAAERAQPPPGAAQSDAASSASGSSRRTVGFVIGGVGIAAAAAGAVTGGLVLGDKSSADQNCPAPSHTCRNQAGAGAVDQGRTLGPVTTALLIAGAAGIGTGVVLVLTSPGSAIGHRAAARRGRRHRRNRASKPILRSRQGDISIVLAARATPTVDPEVARRVRTEDPSATQIRARGAAELSSRSPMAALMVQALLDRRALFTRRLPNPRRTT